ncbi:RNA polymerase sigma factor [Nitratireductor sp. XY-223]|uniref:RNA polymerase sigma factor n=1 Tax=Nitratireductor sp. XY-223 TaxID=2561926 RepID=UPI0010A9EA8A|nr:RNA polymerase sigma factor [Nitratireductor sp. XY-223]
MYMETGDQDLAKSAAEGDSASFQALLERHYDSIYTIAYRYCGAREDAEDIAQEVCVALVRKLPTYRAQSKFRTWLYRITVNAARDHHRKKVSAGKLNRAYAELSDLARGDAEQAAGEQAWLYQCLDRIGEPLRETAILVLAEGMSHREAADILDVKESTVSWRMHEMKKQLKALATEEAQA